ncbi:MAG: hypothetical protein JNM82_13350 [Rhodocyclaceae bacterium]|nr:hypothetical protein [Rhodocyclaceae bacterium]
MNQDPQRLADCLGQIVEAIARIRRQVEDLDQVALQQNAIARDAAIRKGT